MLNKLHHSLNKIAVTKTDIIVANDIVKLKEILADENKHIQAIQKTSQQLMEESKPFSGIHAVIENADEPNKTKLDSLKKELDEQIKKLKDRNSLNQELLQQSLDFVQLSLDMLLPDIESFNYSSNEGEAPASNNGTRSIFDSKA